MAIAGLLLGLIGLLTSPVFIGLLPGAVGLVLSAAANKKKKSGAAIAGMVISSLAVVIPFVLLVFYFTASPEDRETTSRLTSALFLNVLPEKEAVSGNEAERLPEEEAEKEAPAPEPEDEEARESGAERDDGPEETKEAPAGEPYVPPDEKALSVPERLSERTGYEPVAAQIDIVGDEEARRLEQELSIGETGDGLEFAPEIYPYYAMLDDTEKHVYRQLFANAEACNDRFRCVEDRISEAQLYRSFSALVQDHPELFWMNTAYAGRYRNNGSCLELDLSFNRTVKDLDNEKRRFEEAAAELVKGAEGQGSDVEAERYVHDALTEKNRYVTGAEMNQSAYSALVNGKTVCAGYARAFQYVMQKLGRPCFYCSGYAGESHAWNIIGLEDGFTNVDVTWDDTDDGGGPVYDFFNRTDRDFSRDHARRELSIGLPPCNAGEPRDEEERSGEEAPGETLPSLEEKGLSEEDVLRDMDSYYEDCYRQIVEHGPGTWEFTNVIEGEELFREWNEAYDRGETKEGFSLRALEAVGGRSFREVVIPQKLSDGRYLLTHRVTLRAVDRQ